MFKKFFKLVFSVSLLLAPLSVMAAPNSQSHLQWQTNFDSALQESKQTGKPIVLFFTGSDWCSWCNKLEQESLNTAEFINETNGKYIFVKVDFPRGRSLDPATTEQNRKLQDKYGIKGYPTLIVIDGNQKQLGTTGYVAGGGKNYANHLKQIAGK